MVSKLLPYSCKEIIKYANVLDAAIVTDPQGTRSNCHDDREKSHLNVRSQERKLQRPTELNTSGDRTAEDQRQETAVLRSVWDG